MGMHDRAKHPLPRQRWDRIKDLDAGSGRYVHVSAEARMVPVPMPFRTDYKPWVQKPGVTYNVGRNKAKRLRREAEKAGL